MRCSVRGDRRIGDDAARRGAGAGPVAGPLGVGGGLKGRVEGGWPAFGRHSPDGRGTRALWKQRVQHAADDRAPLA